MRDDEFTQAYLEAALWSSTDDEGNPLDKDFGVGDIAPAILEEMIRDAENFQKENSEFIPVDRLSNAGHDFWLTRNGHGAGFWETPDWPERAGYRLTQSAESYGEYTLYVGDDGQIYGM
jgi:hypothetical protein